MSVASLFDLTGRVAMVTGGNAGVGKAIAWALASAGASVLLVARRVGVLDDAVYEFQHAGLKAAPLRCDLADRDSLNVLASHAATFFGAPDILVNAAGINPRKPFDTPTDDHWDATLALNLSAPFLLTRALAPAMRQRGWGRVINVASLQGERAFPNSAPYGASKAGLVQLTRATAEFWSPHGITCNALAPGFFPT